MIDPLVQLIGLGLLALIAAAQVAGLAWHIYTARQERAALEAHVTAIRQAPGRTGAGHRDTPPARRIYH